MNWSTGAGNLSRHKQHTQGLVQIVKNKPVRHRTMLLCEVVPAEHSFFTFSTKRLPRGSHAMGIQAMDKIEPREGLPYPLGASWDGKGVNFALFSAELDVKDVTWINARGTEAR
jgi:hypothetical protein